MPRHAPPGGGGAVHRVHLRVEAQGGVDRALEQVFQGLLHRGAGNGDLQLVAVAGDGQLLMLMGREDHAPVAVRAQQAPGLGQLLLAGQRQAQAVAIEVHLVADADGDVGAVLDMAQGRGHGRQHIAAVMELDAFRPGRLEQVRAANIGHPGTRSGQIVAIGGNVPKMRIVLRTHHAAPTAIWTARSDGAST
ncbi:hypothetical protein FQZ97_792610 [compost metagenome]